MSSVHKKIQLKNKDKKCSLLIIEDEDSILFPLVYVIKKRKIPNLKHIFTASNGSTGLKIALTEKPNLIVTDILIPKMDGKQVIKEIRKTLWGKSVPIVIFTNMPFNKTRPFAKKYNIENCLTKTHTGIDQVADVIQKTLFKFT